MCTEFIAEEETGNHDPLRWGFSGIGRQELTNSLGKRKELRDVLMNKEASDGLSANYYVLPKGAEQLQDLISHRNMNAQIGEIFRACYRYGLVAHSPCSRDIKKIIFYAQAELKRLENLESNKGA